METTHRMKVKIGVNEFEAEGEQELVKQQYADFLSAVSQAPAPAPLTISSPAASSVVDSPLEKRDDPASIPQSVIDRVFRRGDPLSLLATPKGDNAEADALLVLIYGLTELVGQPAVTGTMLAKAAGKSGVNAGRISRTLEKREEFIQAAGFKKGRRYSLNNRGIAEAKRIIEEMVK